MKVVEKELKKFFDWNVDRLRNGAHILFQDLDYADQDEWKPCSTCVGVIRKTLTRVYEVGHRNGKRTCLLR